MIFAALIGHKAWAAGFASELLFVFVPKIREIGDQTPARIAELEKKIAELEDLQD